MMSTLLMTGILFAFAGFGALKMRRRFEEQLPLAVGAVVVVLYVFALFGALKAGVYAVLGFAALALAAQAVCLVRERSAWKRLLTPGCAAFFLVALWLLMSFRGYMFSAWDDFSHWGAAVKNMSIFGALPTAVQEATLTYTDYPPATTLFSWLWTHLSGVFNEEDAQRALNMMIMCFLLPAMSGQDWKRPGRALCMSSVLFLLPLIFQENVFRTLQVDVLMGCMTLYALWTWFLSDQNIAGVSVVMLLLPLVKGTGAAMAALVLVIIGVDILCSRRQKKIALIGLMAGLLLIGKLSWNVFLNIHQIGGVWNQDAMTLGNVIRALTGRGTAQQKSIMGLYAEKLGASDLWGSADAVRMSFVVWMLVTAVVQHLSLACVGEDEKKRLLRTYRMLFVGMALYVVALMLMYLFIFRPDEAIYLGSLQRYLATFMIPLVGFTALTAIQKADQKGLPGGLHAPLCGLLCFALVVSPAAVVRETITASTRIQTVYEERMSDLIPYEVTSQLDSCTDRVYLVATGDNGWQYYKGAYQLAPVPVQEGMWTTWPVAVKTADWGEISAVEYSAQDWARILSEFTHVYLDTVNQRFIEDYETLFASDVREGMLYRVEKTGDGVKLHAAQ